ncbi:MAG: RNA methyltransferase [Planctomycetes bacterium]|nr:RNA methyltransferase [Planctomycetota bacterium]
MKRVVLVRTLGPRNVGSVMRAAANFGADDLVLVAPQRPSMLVHPEFVQMAHGVEDVRAKIRVVPTLAEALQDTTRSIGFTARARGQRKRADWRAVSGDVALAAADPGQRVALVFGSEESGLSVDETDQLGELCSLPTAPEHTSLNLSLAVGIVLFTLFRGKGVHVREKGPVLAARESAELLKARLKDVLGRAALSPQACRDIQASVERVFTRAPIESRDARAWHKILQALDGQAHPRNLGVAAIPRDARRRRALEAREQKQPPG